MGAIIVSFLLVCYGWDNTCKIHKPMLGMDVVISHHHFHDLEHFNTDILRFCHIWGWHQECWLVQNNAQVILKKKSCFLTTKMQTETVRLQQQMVLLQEAVSSITNRCCIWHPEHQQAMSLCISRPAPITRSIGLPVSCLVGWKLGCKSKRAIRLVMINELNKRRKHIHLTSREKVKEWCHLKPVAITPPLPPSHCLAFLPLCTQQDQKNKTKQKKHLQVPHKTC